MGSEGATRLQLLSVLASAVAANPTPDDDEGPSGPGASRIRQQIAALALLQLASLISDHATRETIHMVVTNVLVAHDQRAQHCHVSPS